MKDNIFVAELNNWYTQVDTTIPLFCVEIFHSTSLQNYIS